MYCYAAGTVPTVFGLDQGLQTVIITFLVLVEVCQLELFMSLILGLSISTADDTGATASFLQAAPAAVGPILLATGSVAISTGIAEKNFFAERDNANVPTGIVNAFVRHPIYAGILAAAWGWTIEAGGGSRVFMTLVLWYLLSEQANKDEARLLSAENHEEYKLYKRKVRGKLVPLLWPQSTSLWSPYYFDPENY
jgi:protein-S-isoprenylcysteine O-methyltransferase Ste14